jgi:hypothetical protein
MTERPSILDALEMWSTWHGDMSPLGSTGDYALDMLLADAFRALLYRPALQDRLDWIERELHRRTIKRVSDRYNAHLIRWWNDMFEATKLPVIESRMNNRRQVLCVSA